MGVTHTGDPVPLIMSELAESIDSVETLEILNIITNLSDHYGYNFKVSERSIGNPYREIDNRLNRLVP